MAATPLPLVKSDSESFNAFGAVIGNIMQIINQLAKSLNLSELDVELYLQNAPSKYKVYKIRKRTIGFRLIAQPTKKKKPKLTSIPQVLAYSRNLGV
ncbi:hypothetical protein [Providencia manganoxydans]|uniref:hypothetical protein n=1 Tax=Providencia manganoxydans TaxID=2923283 RepID=UPI0032DB5264